MKEDLLLLRLGRWFWLLRLLLWLVLFLRIFLLLCAASIFFCYLRVVFVTHDTATFHLHVLSVAFIVVFCSFLDEIGEVFLVFLIHLNNSKSSCRFLVHYLAQASLAFHNQIWDTLFSAQRWQPQYKLNGIHIVSNNDQLGCLLLNEGSYVIQTELNELGFFWFHQALLRQPWLD